MHPTACDGAQRGQNKSGASSLKFLQRWRREAEQARRAKPTEIEALYGTADVVGNSRVVFDICGNRYRLIVQFNYVAQVARVRFAGTHAEYDEIDATTV